LLLQTPLPSMGKVFSLLLQEESQRTLTNMVGIPIDSQAMVAEQHHNPIPSQVQHMLHVLLNKKENLRQLAPTMDIQDTLLINAFR